MLKNFKFYVIIWAAVVALFNVAVFLVQPVIPGYVFVHDERFWVAWGFVIGAFVGNLVCSFITFKSKNSTKLFYNLPLIRISYITLIIMLVAGAALLIIPGCPAWIAAIVCVIIFVFNIIALTKAKWAAGTVEGIDEKVREQTGFIKNLTAEAEIILSNAKNEQIKSICKKLYDSVRYSDPVSNESLFDIEMRIEDLMGKLRLLVDKDELEKVETISEELGKLISERNKKCKVLK